VPRRRRGGTVQIDQEFCQRHQGAYDLLHPARRCSGVAGWAISGGDHSGLLHALIRGMLTRWSPGSETFRMPQITDSFL
jgi:hypothetical protein